MFGAGKKFLAFVLVAAITCVFAAPSASAAGLTPPSNRGATLTLALISKVDPYVVHTPTGYVLSGTPKGITASELKAVKQQIAQANKLDQALRSAPGVQQVGKTHVIVATVAGGENKMVSYWWGFELYMDHSKTQEMVYQLNQAAGAAGIGSLIISCVPAAGLIPGAIGGIAAFLMVMGANAISHADQGNGVYIRFAFGFPAGVYAQ